MRRIPLASPAAAAANAAANAAAAVALARCHIIAIKTRLHRNPISTLTHSYDIVIRFRAAKHA
jgi:hypothetical protein